MRPTTPLEVLLNLMMLGSFSRYCLSRYCEACQVLNRGASRGVHLTVPACLLLDSSKPQLNAGIRCCNEQCCRRTWLVSICADVLCGAFSSSVHLHFAQQVHVAHVMRFWCAQQCAQDAVRSEQSRFHHIRSTSTTVLLPGQLICILLVL